MTVRKRFLSDGWYPQDEASAAGNVDSLIDDARLHGFAAETDALAVVAPHASWFYSGALAAAAVSSLRRDAETVIVFGGHLSDVSEPLAASEDAFSTPFGPLEADDDLRGQILSGFDVKSDRVPDNTVEIQLPLVKRLFPSARVLWLRMPASMRSYDIGRALGGIASQPGKRIVALGSTDLTHYGPNYGFLPKGQGSEALRWVRETNDRRFIDSLLAGDAEQALERALTEGSACSPGAAVAALAFAQALGASNASLLGYATSADIAPSSSFVGYAALSWTLR